MLLIVEKKKKKSNLMLGFIVQWGKTNMLVSSPPQNQSWLAGDLQNELLLGSSLKKN